VKLEGTGALWYGTFGDEYTVRNEGDYSLRKSFWDKILKITNPRTVLEIGCNTGMNLDIIAQRILEDFSVWGCDVNYPSVNLCHIRHKEVNCVVCSGYDLPFRDGYFDLVFTAGVLIHQKPEEVDKLMQEIIRISGKWVLAIEYDADIFEEIPYRKQSRALFRGPYGQIYETKYGLRLITQGVVGKDESFDDCTWWLLSKE
jgi:ubiquinone/menaquinone biosynthesis C-methylase UbiE